MIRSMIEIEQSTAEEILSFLANPNVAYLLLALGMLGIYVEVTHPGGIFPGVVGVIAMLLALYSLSVLPLSWAGVGLIAISLLALSVGGQGDQLRSADGGRRDLLRPRFADALRRPDSRHEGQPRSGAADGGGRGGSDGSSARSRHPQAAPQPGHDRREGLVGEIGRHWPISRPDGKVLVHGEYWDARSTGGPHRPRVARCESRRSANGGSMSATRAERRLAVEGSE
jgi:membrane-bound serine protease (ClpP class)